MSFWSKLTLKWINFHIVSFPSWNTALKFFYYFSWYLKKCLSNSSWFLSLWMEVVFICNYILLRSALLVVSVMRIKMYFFPPGSFFLTVVWCAANSFTQSGLRLIRTQVGCPLCKATKHLCQTSTTTGHINNQEIFCTAANTSRSLETSLAAVLDHFDIEQEKVRNGS